MMLLSSCETPPPAMPDFCTWAKEIIPGDGFQSRWTREEKEQVLSLDQKIIQFCRQPPKGN